MREITALLLGFGLARILSSLDFLHDTYPSGDSERSRRLPIKQSEQLWVLKVGCDELAAMDPSHPMNTRSSWRWLIGLSTKEAPRL